MISITIVALPEEDEAVWDLSSEKKPHLTLLNMNGPLGDLENTLQFIQHAARTSLNKFGLSVDHRGTLGPEDADVLFFSQEYGVDQLRDFRAQLLKNDDIAKAYVQTEQFPGWIPHLTMGYPNSPAKEPDENNKWGLKWINFDRIAVWTGDFEGPEFRLDSDSSRSIGPDAAWSEEYGVHLLHYGKLGMRWGYRRSVGSDGLVKGPPLSKKPGDVSKLVSKVQGTAPQGAKVSADHTRAKAALAKKVEELDTNEIKEITKRVRAVKEFHEEVAKEKARNASPGKKLTTWALNAIKEGARIQGEQYLKDYTGDLIGDLGLRTRAQQERKAKADAAAKTEAAKKEESKPKPDPEKKKAIVDLVDEVYNVTTLPEKKEE